MDNNTIIAVVGSGATVFTAWMGVRSARKRSLTKRIDLAKKIESDSERNPELEKLALEAGRSNKDSELERALDAITDPKIRDRIRMKLL